MDRPSVEPITSLGDAQARLHYAADLIEAVSEWLRHEHLWDDQSEEWRVQLDRERLDLRTLAHAIQFVGEGGAD